MRTIRLIALSSLLAATAFVSSGPPWISIEYPGNPYDSNTRDAYLYVHTFHHAVPASNPVSGTAEGLVAGARRTISLEFKTTPRPGVYALRKQWPADGLWTLVIGATQGEGEHNTAWAIVELGSDGAVSRVAVPTTRANGYVVPALVAMDDVERALRVRAGQVAAR